MDLQTVILKPDDTQTLLDFDEKRLIARISDDIERQFALWHSRSRREALEHYLPLGWSFGVWQSEVLLGYFLAQPLLFYSGVTQTLWVETLNFTTEKIAFQLIDTAVRMAREKHFQRALFSDCQSYATLLNDFKGKLHSESVYEVRTSKMI